MQTALARAATDAAHQTLERHAVGAMAVAARAVQRDPTKPAQSVAAAVWRSGAWAASARAALDYVDQLAALTPIPDRPSVRPTIAPGDTPALLAARVAHAMGRAHLAARRFARARGARTTDAVVQGHLHQLVGLECSRIAHDAAVQAWRTAAQARMVQLPSVTGWRRVAEPNACGACLALMDGSIHPAAEDMVVHTRDRCLAEPVVIGVNDEHWGRQTGEQLFHSKSVAEQDDLFAGRGGAAKAQLVRGNHIAFADLAQVADERLGNTPVALSETPLAALQAQDA